jgi:hypothetical protein
VIIIYFPRAFSRLGVGEHEETRMNVNKEENLGFFVLAYTG